MEKKASISLGSDEGHYTNDKPSMRTLRRQVERRFEHILELASRNDDELKTLDDTLIKILSVYAPVVPGADVGVDVGEDIEGIIASYNVPTYTKPQLKSLMQKIFNSLKTHITSKSSIPHYRTQEPGQFGYNARNNDGTTLTLFDAYLSNTTSIIIQCFGSSYIKLTALSDGSIVVDENNRTKTYRVSQANIKNFVSLIANRAVKLTNATFGKQIIITDLTPTPMRYVATTK